jgi:hypothetical protein
MSDLKLFSNALANSDLFKSLQEVNKNLLGGSTNDRRRISLNGGKFREFVGGEQVRVSKEDNMNIVIINAAKISRTYYEGNYDPANPTPPKCWSADTNEPAPEVPEDQRMADRCMDCPMNIKGSGQGESRACRFNQRLAVALEDDLEKIYQLQLPATSIFGAAQGDNMGMQAYAKFLAAHNAPAVAVVTNMRFDENSSTPKLFFKAVRPLNEDELETAAKMIDHEDTIKAITLTVAQTDNVQAPVAVEPEAKKPTPKQKPAPKKKAEPKSLFESDDSAEEVEEPTKMVKKTAKPTPVEDDELSSIIDNWDD